MCRGPRCWRRYWRAPGPATPCFRAAMGGLECRKQSGTWRRPQSMPCAPTLRGLRVATTCARSTSGTKQPCDFFVFLLRRSMPLVVLHDMICLRVCALNFPLRNHGRGRNKQIHYKKLIKTYTLGPDSCRYIYIYIYTYSAP